MIKAAHIFRKGLGAACLAVLMSTATVSAQTGTERTESTVRSEKDRWAFRTNTLGWVALTPNVAVEFDLTRADRNKWTLGVQAAWNGNTGISTGKENRFAVNDYRIEGRKYFRPSLRMKPGSKRIPKFWRTYYVGLYAGYSKLDFLWKKKGCNAEVLHAGITGGWEVPLYQCKNGSIDLDLGLSIGVLYAKYDKYRAEKETITYTERRDRQFIKYPLPTDLRIGFIYRFTSIKNKYQK